MTETKVVRIKRPEELKGELRQIGGSGNDDFNAVVLNQAVAGLWGAHSDEKSLDLQIGAVLSAMMGFGPQDELEGMLAAQAVAIHNAAMECFRRAMLPEQPLQSRCENLKYGAKLSQVYVAQLEALARHRGKGHQTVRVEHVTVQAGGQAIVGTVTPGGGAAPKSEEQPHAKQVAYAPGETVPRNLEAQPTAMSSTG